MTPIPLSPLQFVALLYRGATPPPGFVEIRYLPGGTRSWMPWPAFEGHPDEYHLTQAPAGKDVYLGVSLRTETGDYKGVGGAANCHPPHLVWTDIDLKDHPEFTGGQTDVLSMTTEELAEYKQAMLAMVLALCESRKLPPRAIVDSGHGLQVYWARRARSTPEDTERFNLGLLDVFGGDPKSYDVARILRLPGSRNLPPAGAGDLGRRGSLGRRQRAAGTDRASHPPQGTYACWPFPAPSGR
jgi:putative DNA primase/helicase